MENVKKKSIGALLLASGYGNRLNSNIPKQFLKIGSKTILEITLEKFINIDIFSCVVIVVNKEHKTLIHKIKKKYKKVQFINGGGNRQESSYNGLLVMFKKLKLKKVLIHDIVRPNVSKALIKKVCDELTKNNAVIPIINVKDSIKEINGSFIKRNISRENIYFSQTPQAFDLRLLYNAYRLIGRKNLNDFTDDAQIFANSNKKIFTIIGEDTNFKITTQQDFKYAEFLYEKNKMVVVGHGFDVHGFKKGKYLTLLGVRIPFNKSLDGHSDADVGIHSIIDAILGALTLGDIGKLFPNNQVKYKNIDSTKLLKKVSELITKANAEVVHIDCTVICEQPKIQKYISNMRKRISGVLNIDVSKISIKATTTEKLGFIGRGEGIASQSIVTVKKENTYA